MGKWMKPSEFILSKIIGGSIACPFKWLNYNKFLNVGNFDTKKNRASFFFIICIICEAGDRTSDLEIDNTFLMSIELGSF